MQLNIKQKPTAYI